MLDDVMRGKQKDVERPKRSHDAHAAGFGVEQSILASDHLLIQNWDLLRFQERQKPTLCPHECILSLPL